VLPIAFAACFGTTVLTAGPAQAYSVAPGDTVSHIALRHGTTVAAIREANDLDARALIRVGQVLTVPGPGSGAPAAAVAYTVQRGDTLSHIAVRSGTTVAALRAANPGLDAKSTIRVGQRLAVPASGTPAQKRAQKPAKQPAQKMPNTFAGRTYPDEVVAAATRNRDVLADRDVPSRSEMRRIIADTAREWGVDPALAMALAYQESGFNMRAVSPANAIGAMQVIPSSGRWASDLAGRRLDLLDPRDNATAGVVILRTLLRSEADVRTALAAYYQGQTSVRRNGMYDDTKRYVENVRALTKRFS
jgi:soluble lytic murein transglycosylase-like protein